MKRARSAARSHRAGFTLIELLVVVGIISVISGLLLPLLIRARDRARKVNAAAAPPVSATAGRGAAQAVASSGPPLPSGLAPIIDSVQLDMALASSYHRIGMDIFTRYRVDCAGSIVFRHPGSDGDGAQQPQRVLLVIPFPDDIVEARDVELNVRDAAASAENAVMYDRTGIYLARRMNPGQTLTADVRFTAFGRERFDYALPPARQLRSVAVTLKLAGGEARVVPDESLQPSAETPDRLSWTFRNLVSDRLISVLIPGAQAPLARVLLLSRLVAVAVLLFGAGFWFLSEQSRPGQLDRFRLGHFLLLALTYSLFFVAFAVLEFHGRFGTHVSMAVAAALSLPLLVLHVSRVLNLRFALTRVVPLTLFTLGLVINGVYTGAARDYVFLAAVTLTMAFVTVSYPSWAAGQERRRREQAETYASRCLALAEKITNDIGGQIAGMNALAASAVNRPTGAQATLEDAPARMGRVRESLEGVNKEYESLTKRLSALPSRPSWEAAENCNSLDSDADAFQGRLRPHLARLQAEVAAVQALRRDALAPSGESSQTHCAACGQAAVPGAPFCPHCGAALPRTIACAVCSERITFPSHLIPEERKREGMHCPRCGTHLMLPQ